MKPTMIYPERKTRVAIYTRKSNNEGLEEKLNSLEVQRESAEACILMHKADGWEALPQRYDDGACSGGNTERPAFQRLLADVRSGKIDVVLVYKVDRFSRKLKDFVECLSVLEAHQTAFVSVKESFDTTTSMGKLLLGILMVFAEFERENGAERVRDRMASARKKGKWTGSIPPLGYLVDPLKKRLVIDPAEAVVVRRIYTRYLHLGSALAVIKELNAEGVSTKKWVSKAGKVRGARKWGQGDIYRILRHHGYLGEVFYKGTIYPGEHEPIIERSLWDRVHVRLGAVTRSTANATRSTTPGFLKGLARCAGCGGAMTMGWTKSKATKYRYYRCSSAAKAGSATCTVGSIAAGEIEQAVLTQLSNVFRSAEMVAAVSQKYSELHGDPIDHRVVLLALEGVQDVWAELFPGEQERIAALLIEDLIVGLDGCTLRLRANAMKNTFDVGQAANAGAASITKKEDIVEVRLNLQARRLCGRTVMVAPSHPEKTSKPNPLQIAVAKAFRWQAEIEAGRIHNISALAQQENVDEKYIRNILSLALLAPQHVEAILREDEEYASIQDVTKRVKKLTAWPQLLVG